MDNPYFILVHYTKIVPEIGEEIEKICFFKDINEAVKYKEFLDNRGNQPTIESISRKRIETMCLELTPEEKQRTQMYFGNKKYRINLENAHTIRESIYSQYK